MQTKKKDAQNAKFSDISLHLGTNGTPSTCNCSWNPYLLYEQTVMLKMIMLQHEIVKVVNIIFWSSTRRITGCVALWINLGYRMKVAASSKKTDACLSDYTPSDLTQVSLNNDYV